MKYNRYHLNIIFIILIVNIACKKSFLETPDKSVLLQQAYVKDIKTMGDYLNGVYYELSTSFYTGLMRIYPDLIADNIKPSTGTYLQTHYSWIQQPDEDRPTTLSQLSQNSNGIWFSGYRIIHNSSFVIENIDKYRSENSDKADDLKGQAFALRALAHFFLVNTFAQSYNFTSDGSHPGIPYIKTFDWRDAATRQPVEEVYSNMISDLNEAIQLLADNASDTRVMNKAAAKALLARIYLFKSDYQAAKNAAREIGIRYPLLTIASGYPNNVYKLLPINQTESLFQLAPAATGVTGSAGNYFTFFAGFYFNTTVRFTATNDIAIILKENPMDVRNSWVSQSGTTWNIMKYPLNMISGFPAPGSRAYFETLFRTSEMFLTAAEAYAKLNNEDSARYFLNAIRLRSNPTVSSTSATGMALLDSIYKERRKELAFEGLRMFDLQRLKKAVNRTDAPIPTAQNLPYPSDKAISPIPITDVNLGGLTQNNGYN